MRIFRDLWWFFKQEKRSYLIGIILLIMVAGLELLPPKVIGWTVDAIREEKLTHKLLVEMISLLLGAAIVAYVMRYMWRIMIFGTSIKLAQQLRSSLYKHFTKMNQAFYQRKRIGDLMAHATNDIQAIQQTAGVGVLTLIDSLITGGLVLITMAATISWKLTLISLIPMPFMALLTSYYGQLLHKHFHHAQEAFSSLNDKVQESITGVKVIKTFGEEYADIEEFRQQSSDVVRKNMKVARIDSLFDPTISLIVGLSFLLALIFGSQMVLRDEISLGQLVTFTTYLGLLIWPMLAFGWLFNIVERGRASYDRVFSLFRERNEIDEKKDGVKEAPRGSLDISIRAFQYPHSNEDALRDLVFTVHRGQTLGIVGKTGAGKTTLLKLLIREFEVTEGQVIFGDYNIKDYTFDVLYRSIGYVPQDHFLFSTTVASNIAFANEKVDHSEIERVAKIAHVHEDIIDFTDKYNTVVGEKGVSLSGGQKQRLAIARALLMNPELLILDDSLSAVDGKTESRILQSLKKNRKNKTTVITSHRLSAIAHADLILVLDKGEIIQRGTHDDLLKREGWYQDMYVRQQLETIVEAGGYETNEK
ncbi:ATP-binding cassette domain-containing protein [Priestia megaterium]|nr:ATP-binding cassette domain-containing protein [Priestia megaterium]